MVKKITIEIINTLTEVTKNAGPKGSLKPEKNDKMINMLTKVTNMLVPRKVCTLKKNDKNNK